MSTTSPASSLRTHIPCPSCSIVMVASHGNIVAPSPRSMLNLKNVCMQGNVSMVDVCRKKDQIQILLCVLQLTSLDDTGTVDCNAIIKLISVSEINLTNK